MNVTRARLAVYMYVQILLEVISVLVTVAIIWEVMGKNAMVNKTIFFILQYNDRIPFLTDINECIEGTSGCAHNCTNTIGSYNCSCGAGLILTNQDECEGCV